jgi:hypothetical protein
MATIRAVVTSLLLFVVICSCSQNRTFLTDEEVKWNPYDEGDVLVFESPGFERDTIYIKEVSFVFPDGIGVVDYNQSLRILANHTDPKNENREWETYILTLSAKTRNDPSHVVFDLRAKNAQFVEQRFSFDHLNKLKEIELSVPYGTFDDVICINNTRNFPTIPRAIEIIFWSKSKGYVRFDKFDGTSWKLIDLIKSNKGKN